MARLRGKAGRAPAKKCRPVTGTAFRPSPNFSALTPNFRGRGKPLWEAVRASDAHWDEPHRHRARRLEVQRDTSDDDDDVAGARRQHRHPTRRSVLSAAKSASSLTP